MSFRTLPPKTTQSNESRNTQQSKQQTIRSYKIDPRIDNQLFGIFNLENYKVMKGFIPGKGPNVRLYYTKFQPTQKIASVCIIPGYGQSSSSYHQIADFLARNKFVVHLIDIRGFGYSGGFSIPNSMKQLYYDIEALIRCCQQNLPTFLLVQGLGCTLALNLLTLNPGIPLSGVICISPTFGFPQRKTENKILKAISNYFFSDFLVANNINPTGLTKNNKYIRKRMCEGFNDQYVTLQMKIDLGAAKQNLIQKADQFKYPILIFCGRNNSIQSSSDVQKYFNEIGSKDKSVKFIEGGYHTIHLDEQKQIIKSNIVQWISLRLDKIKFRKMPFKLKHNKVKSQWNKYAVLGCILFLIWLIRKIRVIIRK